MTDWQPGDPVHTQYDAVGLCTKCGCSWFPGDSTDTCPECGYKLNTVTFRLDDDGRHVHWGHDCVGSFGTPHRRKTTLPVGPGRWQLAQAEPLTVTPSILCKLCGCHGFITNGAWCPI
jgi:Family of unknown function (DUF6527)